MITNFPKTPGINIGGNSSFLYIPYYQISSLPAVTGKLITSPVKCKAGYQLLNGYSTLEQLELEETAKDNENGTPYQWEIGGFVPGDSDELIDLMESMEEVRHLVIVRDIMNKQRLVGYNAPLTFKAIFKSGSKPGEARGFQFTFSGMSTQRAPIYKVG